jgi:predicted RNA binding protein YcfA (HicA-like mRNA interferase family)
MKRRDLLRQVAFHPANVRFVEFVYLIEGFGFELARTAGSHHIFVHRQFPVQLNLQSRRGEIKPYQVRQFLRAVEAYNLKLEDEP